MNSMLKTVVLTLAAMILVFLLVGSMLADHWTVATEQGIAAPPVRVLAAVRDFGTWNEWSTVKATLGPTTERTVEGEPGRIGHRVVWRGSIGEAVMALTRADEHGIAYDFLLRVHEEPELHKVGDGSVAIAQDGNGTGTTVTWTDNNVLPTLITRWVAWFGATQNAVQRLQQSSIAGLQSWLDKQAAGVPAAGAGKPVVQPAGK